jgi:hypothetical protein
VPPAPPAPVYNPPAKPGSTKAAAKKGGKVKLSFKESSNGGAPILFTTAKCKPTRKGPTRTAARTGAGPILVKKLKKGVTYKCKVQTTNAAGASPWSNATKVKAK